MMTVTGPLLAARRFAVAAVLILSGGVDLWGQATPRPPDVAEGTTPPRYFSLKSDRVALRQGPGTEYPTAWVFRRAGLPVEVIRESDLWREIRDATGTVGWVHSSLLSRRRTALVLPWEVKDGRSREAAAVLREDDTEHSQAIAHVEAGALVSIIGCESGWCRISIGGYRGYIEQAKLWGTYPNELIR